MELFPGRYFARTQYAVVGLDREVVEGNFDNMAFQVEGLNEFLYSLPLREFRWPDQSSREFAATMSEETETTWSGEGLDISAGYPWNLAHLDGYRLHVSFAPALEATSVEPLSIDDWINLWLRPFTRLISFGTGIIRRPTWVVFANERNSSVGSTKVQLYGSGISQRIYHAARPASHGKERPLFTRADLPSPLPDLISRWRHLEASDNPFPELYRLASAPDLPARARFLYLVQAIEGLHGFENRKEDLANQARHEARRDKLIADIAAAVQANNFTRRLKGMISKRAPDDLSRRVRDVLKSMPGPFRNRLVTEADDRIAHHYATKGKPSFEDVIRLLRNDLSHGNYNPDSIDLARWTQRLDVIGRAQMLRLLGFGPDLVAKRLGDSP
jgi:hypothetical protein